MAEFLTCKIHLKLNDDEYKLMTLLTQIAKNIYNCALYSMRKQYEEQGELLSVSRCKEMLKDNESYKILGEDPATHIIKQVYVSMKQYILYHYPNGDIKPNTEGFTKDNDKFRLPKYLKKMSRFNLQLKKIRRDKTKKYLILPLPDSIKDGSIFKRELKDNLLSQQIKESTLTAAPEIRIKVPKYIKDKNIPIINIMPDRYSNYFYAGVVYATEFKPIVKRNNSKIMGIDIGISNLAACVTTENDSFIIDGLAMKSLIVLYNKRIGQTKKNLPFIDKTENKQKHTSAHLISLYRNFNNKIKDYIEKASSMIKDYCVNHGITRVIIGWNDGIKTNGVKLHEDVTKFTESKINQVFVQMPLSTFKDRLVLKCKMEGIEAIVVNEDFTSSRSFYDGEPLMYKEGKGKRIKRGAYQTANGKIINADINAALNMLRKGERYWNEPIREVEGLKRLKYTNPKRIRIKC